MTTGVFALDTVTPNSPIAYATINLNCAILQSLARNIVRDNALNEPDGSEDEGDLYYVLPTGTTEWAGHDDELAVFIGGTWYFLPLFTGQSFWVTSASARKTWNGAAWV